MQRLEIDTEFQSLCPPLQAEEREQLEASLLAEGCREPLCVWLPVEQGLCERCEEEQPIEYRWDHHPYGQEGDGREGFWICTKCQAPINEDVLKPILLDGHNRYAICVQHDRRYEVRYQWQIASREEAINWIIANQLGRRNLTPEQKSYLRGKRYNLEKWKKGQAHNRHENQNESQRTVDRFAQEYKVSSDTISKDSQFATAVDTLEAQVRQDIRETILRRQDREQGKITKQQAMHTGKLVQEQSVTPQPFMQREGWKPYQVLHAIELLANIPAEHHPALNTMLDQPFTPATDGLTLLKKVAAMNAKGQALIATLALSTDPADRSDAITLALKIPTEPDKQAIIAQSLIHALETVRTQQQRAWIRHFPETPWREELEDIDATMATIQDRWRSIAASIKRARTHKVDSYAATLTD